MLDCVLAKRNLSHFKKITLKAVVAALTVAAAVILPMIVHLAYGSIGGGVFMPMYIPVIFGAAFMGKAWGSAIALLSPLVSFAVTSVISNPMPSVQKLPFIMAELLVFALVCGSFSKKIANNVSFTFIAVLLSQIAGRSTLVVLNLAFGSVSAALTQVYNGIFALILQLALIPLLMLLIKKFQK